MRGDDAIDSGRSDMMIAGLGPPTGIPPRPRRPQATLLAVGLAAAVLHAHARDGWRYDPPAAGADMGRPIPGTAARAAEPDLGCCPGVIEAIPRNVFHASPYNDWPLFELLVHEGQRLRFRRENGAWVGDRTGLFVQFETPAEVVSKEEDVEVADLEARMAALGRDILRDQLDRDLKSASIREEGARQQLDRLERLRGRTAVPQAELDGARNLAALARAQLEQAERQTEKKAQMASLQASLADHRAKRARSELDLANFKREMSWASIPVERGRFEEVVVTKVQAARGDTPSSGRGKDVWVEVVDDRAVQARAFVSADQARRLVVGRATAVRQGGRAYRGEVASIGGLADRATHLVPVLVKVDNGDRGLRLNTEVVLDLSQPGRGR